MVGQVIRALIYICVMALLFWLVVYVLAAIGFVLPLMVERILMVIFGLVCLLVLWQLFSPNLSRIDWWGRNPPP